MLRGLGALVAQFFFIGAGIFLGMQADNWREEREHREAARAALVNFRTELATNRATLARKHVTHARLHAGFDSVVSGSTIRPRSVAEMMRRVGWDGADPVAFGRAAWDLALANGSLTWVEPKVAFALASVYDEQRYLEELQDRVLGGAMSPTGLDDTAAWGLTLSLHVFFNDAARFIEPALLRRYDVLLPRLDREIARLSR